MKGTSTALKAHMAGATTTICFMWKVTRKDNVIFTFTEHDRDVVYAGHTYLAATGFTASNITTSDMLNVDNLEVDSVLNSATITDADLLAGLWDYASIEIFRVNYMDLSMGIEWMRKGTIGEVSTGRVSFIAELRGIMQAYQQSIGRVINAACDADLGDARCKIVLATYTVTGNLTAAADNATFTDSGRAQATGYFTGGLLTWTSGLNNTYKKEVKTFTSGGAFVLVEPMPNLVQVGDTYSVYAGCDKIDTTCAAKFNNIVNFRGFNSVPGQDRLLSAT